eukprot:COSAG05_NODE_1326_length_5179_cov_477.427756_1_plen_570_part_00
MELTLGSSIAQVELTAVHKADALEGRLDSLTRDTAANLQKLTAQSTQQGEAMKTALAVASSESEEAIRIVDTVSSQRIDQVAKSITELEEALVGTMQGQEDRLTTAVSGCVAGLDSFRRDIVDKHAFLEQKFGDKISAQDERVDELSSNVLEVRTHFTDVCYTLDTRLQGEIADIRQQSEQAEALTNDFHAEVDARMSDSVADWKAQLAREHEDSQVAVSDLSGRLDDVARSQHELLTTSVSRLEQRFGEQSALLTKRLDSEHLHFHNLCEGLDASISSTQRDGAAELRMVEEALNQKFGDKVVATDARVAAMGRHFTDVCTAIERTFNSNLDELDSAFINGCKSLDVKTAAIAADLSELSAESSKRLEQLATDIAEENSSRTEAAQALKAQVLHAIGAAETSFSDDLKALEKAEQENHVVLTERQDQVSKIVESLSDELGAIEVKLVGELTSLQQTVNVDVKKQLSSLDQDLRSEVSTKLGLMNAQIKQEMEPALEQTSVLSRKLASDLESLKTRVSLDVGDLKAGVTKNMEDLAKQVDDMDTRVADVTQMSDINVLLTGCAVAAGDA